MDVGKKIKKLRKERRMTLEELSKKTGLSLSYLSLIERGLKNPSLKALQKIADSFGISPVLLFSSEDFHMTLESFLRNNTRLNEEEIKMVIQIIESLEKSKDTSKSEK
ncbi:MAG: XRE family transcriptional regulator [Dictyoglomus sp. NZ13-RE01]|nr:MAG: XRE family transcriptional regulator [Dictyoglomus sp. NZ13-RE01]